jgi:hypothetical protein
MTTSLRSRLGELAASFATSVLDAVRGSSLHDILSESSGSRSRSGAAAVGRVPPAEAPGPAGPARRRRRGRLPRRSATQIASVVERIAALLKQFPRGLRAEQIREKLGLQSKELPRPLKEALDGGRISKSGQRRATTYFVKGASPPREATAKAAKRASRSRSRKATRRAVRKPRPKAAAKAGGARSRRKKAPRAARRSRAAARRGKRVSTGKDSKHGNHRRVRAGAGAKPAQPAAAASGAQEPSATPPS